MCVACVTEEETAKQEELKSKKRLELEALDTPSLRARWAKLVSEGKVDEGKIYV